mmetsp:Transcript_7890/g.22368  ORF Transcript_7890/g.22368 Transcript_7890/m.22368 type:complete len:223 (+) Transcript_7890:302-970(+)
MSIASSGVKMPSSTSSLADMVPARPMPPRQWTCTRPPFLRTARASCPPPLTQAVSKSDPGALKSRMGRCRHRMPLSKTASPMPATPSLSISDFSIRVSTREAPEAAMASRSAVRSRSRFPGHSEMPIAADESGRRMLKILRGGGWGWEIGEWARAADVRHGSRVAMGGGGRWGERGGRKEQQEGGLNTTYRDTDRHGHTQQEQIWEPGSGGSMDGWMDDVHI